MPVRRAAEPARTSRRAGPSVPAGRARPARACSASSGTGDTSGFGGLQLPGYVPAPAERPYGGYFDEVVDALDEALAERGVDGAVEQVVVDRGEITFYVARERLLELCPGAARRRGAALRAVLLGVRRRLPRRGRRARLHVVYHLTSMTYRRRIRLEVAVDRRGRRTCPASSSVYPTADWHERETWDMFGVVFDGHPALTRILMPDDWDGHPQRKDYPLGGIPVEYKGAEIPPPDQQEGVLDDATIRTTTARRVRPADERITTEGRVYTVTGGDWDTTFGADPHDDERIVVNMGPQHPSTHGVLRLVLELEGETVTEARSVDRLPAHRHREEPRVPHLDPGRRPS